MKKFALPVLALLALTACSGEPGESAMRKAIENEIKGQIEQAQTMAKAFGGEEMAKTLVGEFTGFDRFEKKSCEAVADRKETYICTYAYLATVGKQTRNSDNARATLIKTDKGWKALDFNG